MEEVYCKALGCLNLFIPGPHHRKYCSDACRSRQKGRDKYWNNLEREKLRHRIKALKDPEGCRRRARKYAATEKGLSNSRMRNNTPEQKARVRLWGLKNPEKLKQYTREWRDRNKERFNFTHRRRYFAKRAGVSNLLTYMEWKKMLLDSNYTCVYCGRDISGRGNATQDHVIPISRGGKHTPDNVVPACFSCNSKKSDRDLDEFLGSLE